MRKLLSLILGLIFISAVFVKGEDTSVVNKSFDPNAKTSEGSPNTIPVYKGHRGLGDILMDIDLAAIGMPGDGYDNAGITSDGHYVYLINMYNNKCYVIDPSGPSIVTSWNAPSGLSWGCGHENNIWISEYNTKNYYEYTFAGTPTGAYFYGLQGGASWMADACEWWQTGEIWCLAVGGSNKAYKFSIPSGTLLDSIGHPKWTYISQRGLTYDPWNNKFWVGGWNSDSVWELNPDGSPTGRSFAFTDIASLSYDYMPSIHPAPVLWLATNALNNHLYMIDPDNPVPQDTIRWTFETGWQGWTHSSSYTFPNAWGVARSNLRPGWMPPNAQDSCLWFDDDAAGSGAPPLKDTALSPVIVPHSTTNWLKWGVTYNYLASPEKLEVGIKYFNGSTWTVVPLKTYTADINGARDSADISAYKTYPRLQVYAYYDDGNGWMWYGAIDNVTINGELYVATHDVGTTAINQPPDNLLPNTTYQPTATYKNFGNNNETFNVYFVIDSSGTIVYNQTQNITVNAGEDTVIVFPNWTCCGTTGITYTFKAYTVLAGDVNPANDTLTKNAVVNPTFWEILSAQFPSPSSGHSMATINDGKYMVFGIRTTGGYTNQTQIYNIAAGSWTAGPNNPYGCGAYGTAQGVHGKYYRHGGTDSWPTALTRVDIYDPVSNQWSSGAPSPTANVDHVSGVYKDSLIFTFGGGNWGGAVSPHTNVYFYDTYLNTWTQATSMTGVGRGCAAGGVIDTFAIVACGYDGSSTYRNDYIVGRINPTNCSQITWGSPTTIPGMTDGRYRVPSGVDHVNKELWVVCGQTASGSSDQTWSYNPYTNTWTNWNKPKPTPVGNVSPIAVTLSAAGDIGVFVVSGYQGGAYVPAHEVFHTGHVPGVQEKPNVPISQLKFGFAPNMPNPTKDYAPISYATTKSGKVTLRVYDATGRLVRTLVNRPNEPAGAKTVYWNGEDDNRRPVTGGVYFIKLEAEGKVATHKLVLVK